MSQKDCIAKFVSKINPTELLGLQEQYVEEGQDQNTAMISAVQEKIDSLKAEQKKVVTLVREAWAKDDPKAPAIVKDDTQANDEPLPAISEEQARKQIEWRNLGQKDGTKTHALYFYERPEDKGTNRVMHYGMVELYPMSSGWKVNESGQPHAKLADAKKEATDQAIERLREGGYIAKPQEVKRSDEPWTLTREQAAAEYPGDEYDKMLNRAATLGHITREDAGKRSRINSLGNKEFWAKTKKDLERDKQDAMRFAKGERADINKMKPTESFAKWRIKAMSGKAAAAIKGAEEYHNGLAAVHAERIQEALDEGKDVPPEVLKDYPFLKAGKPQVAEKPLALNGNRDETVTGLKSFFKGDEIEYTGNTEDVGGSLFYEFKYLEGAKEGKTGVTPRRPDGAKAEAPAVSDRFAPEDIDPVETRIGLEVDTQSRDSLILHLDEDLDPATGKKIHSEGRRRELQTELEMLNGSIAAANDFLEVHQQKLNATPEADLSAEAEELKNLFDGSAFSRTPVRDAVGDVLNKLTQSHRSNITPEQEEKLLPIITRAMIKAFDAGYTSFKSAAKYVLDFMTKAIGKVYADAISLSTLQGAYIHLSGKRPAAEKITAVASVTDRSDIERHTATNDNAPKGEKDVSSTDPLLERDSADGSNEPAVGQNLSPRPGPDALRSGRTTAADGVPRVRKPGGAGVDAGVSAPSGEQSDLGLHSDYEPAVTEEFDARADNSERSGDAGFDGVPPDTTPAATVIKTAETLADKTKNRESQIKADKSGVIPGDLDNIKATLPSLHTGQQEDVQTAEIRHAKADGYGMLFTNGTGTGKTYLGLGIIKRQVMQGKSNILIVVPNEKIRDDWMSSGKVLGLNIKELENTKDAGSGVVITTYANVGDNDQLATRKWDMIVPDESHYLMQAADGTVTGALRNIRAIAGHPDGILTKYEMLNRDDINRLAFLHKEIEANDRIRNHDDTMDAVRDALAEQNKKFEEEASKLRKKLSDARDAVKADIMANQGEKRTRLTFLSATPFAYEKTLDWANGFIFDYKEGYPYNEQDAGLKYNQPSPREHFFMSHLGYQMRYNKLTAPDQTKVDSGLLQRSLNTWMIKSGAVSSRMLDVDADYDRRFVLVESAIGTKIDEALNWLDDKAREEAKLQQEGRKTQKAGDEIPPSPYLALRDRILEKFDYLSRRYILESVKAREAIPIVKKHLEMGRKVVVFHDYKKGGAINPFDVNAEFDTKPLPATASPEEVAAHAKFLRDIESHKSVIKQFRDSFPELISGLDDLKSPVEQFKAAFPDISIINGDESKKDNLSRFSKFQNEDSGPHAVLVQSAKNAGWSGHDTTGKNQRVLINLGQPTAPTTAIQQEGRIYRTGQFSNAIMRYLNTGTTWEKMAFATTIAQRASAAENLGMGEKARALKDSFISAFEDSDSYPPGHEGEGTGGKEKDRAVFGALTEWDRAKTNYWAQQKKTSKNKAEEGVDYFATPEPLGLKMAQWLGLVGGQDSLEPSAGHGAIARWLPELTNRTFIEPSTVLRARLAMVTNPGQDKLIHGDFEDHNIVNKYDGIAMNPPFGSGGKTAIEHVAKAARHLRDGGRIVALIPTGPAADAKWEKWFHGSETKAVKPLFSGHPILGDIYAGDTVTTHLSWLKEGKVVGLNKDEFRGKDMLEVKVPGQSGFTLVPADKISNVSPTGKRTVEVKPAADIHMIASIELPSITFARAGTNVMTRIVVLEKQSKTENLSTESGRQIDLRDVTEINELFDRIEHMDMPAKKESDQQKAEAAAQAEAQRKEEAKAEGKKPKAPALKPAELKVGDTVSLGDGEMHKLEIYTTRDGKEKLGVFVQNKDLADKYSQRVFRVGGRGYFIGDFWLNKSGIKAEGGSEFNGTNFSRKQTYTPEFKQWFGDSMAVDEDGKPLVMYHGTNRDFSAFNRLASTERRRVSMDTVGSWFSDNPSKDGGAGMYASGDGAQIMPVYLKIERPKVYVTFSDFLRDMHEAEGRKLEDQNPRGAGSTEGLREKLKLQGYDGIAFTKTNNQELMDTIAEYADAWRNSKKEEFSVKREDRQPFTMKRERLERHLKDLNAELEAFDSSTEFDKQYVWVAFEPSQIKSAIGNNGQFDGNNPDIRYSRASSSGMDVAAAQAAIDKITAKNPSGPKVHVVATAADLPVDAPDDARGMYTRGEVWVVASNNSSYNEVAETYAHEAIAHYGLRTMLGAEGWVQLMGQIQLSIKAGNPQLKAISESIRKTYVDENGKFNLKPIQESDEIAARMVEDAIDPATGEFRPGFGFLKSVFAKVANFLRSLGIDIKFTHAELQGILVNSMRNLQTGEKTNGGGSMAVAHSLLQSYTPEEALKKQEAEAAALKKEQEAMKPQPVKSKPMTADQIDLFNPQDSLFSRKLITGDSGRNYTAQQRQGFAQTGREVTVQSYADKIKAIKADAAMTMKQGLVDQFAPIEALSRDAYGLMRLSKGASGAFEVVLHGGLLKLTDNVYDFDTNNRGGVLNTLFTPLQGEHHDFLWWIAGNRAERLLDESEKAQVDGKKMLADSAITQAEADQATVDAKQKLMQAGALTGNLTGTQLAQQTNLQKQSDQLFKIAKLKSAQAAKMRVKGNELKKTSRENLFGRSTIAAYKSLADGDVAFDYTIKNGPNAGNVTRDRKEIYEDSLITFNKFNKNMLDMAEQSGLIDPESRKIWEHEFYVPFYRETDKDGGAGVTNVKGGVVQQQAFKNLKGGTGKLKTDLLDNTLNNWAHLLDAAAKNRAAIASIEAAENLGVAHEVAEAIKDKSVWLMKDGQKHHYIIDDKKIMVAISSIQYAGMRGPIMDAMTMAKHALTIGVTANPVFKVKNLIRDSVQSVAVSGLSGNIPKNLYKGFLLTNRKSDSHFQLLAGGGTIHFGTMYEGSEAKRVQALIEAGVDPATILDTPGKIKRFMRLAESKIAWYNELGNRGEEINRAALYTQLRAEGYSHAEASLEARDLMDFSMGGSNVGVRFLTQVVPFMNARMQGAYKVGRGANAHKAKFATVIAATAFASLGLLAYYHDDDDWKRREDWDRNNFWWFKVGNTAFRIPKPFEVGVIATLAERSSELWFDKEMTNHRFKEQMISLLRDNLALGIFPWQWQAAKPMAEIWANTDSFTNSQIETRGMERLDIPERYNDRTAMLARLASKAMYPVGGDYSLSPVQIEHLVRGYFGWLGTTIISAPDFILRPALNEPDRATPDNWKKFTGNIVSDLRDAPSRYVTQMYEQAEAVSQAYGTWNDKMQRGKTDEADAYAEKNMDKLKLHEDLEGRIKAESQINQQIRFIDRNEDMSPKVKREEIRELNRMKEEVAKYQ